MWYQVEMWGGATSDTSVNLCLPFQPGNDNILAVRANLMFHVRRGQGLVFLEAGLQSAIFDS